MYLDRNVTLSIMDIILYTVFFQEFAFSNKLSFSQMELNVIKQLLTFRSFSQTIAAQENTYPKLHNQTDLFSS